MKKKKKNHHHDHHDHHQIGTLWHSCEKTISFINENFILWKKGKKKRNNICYSEHVIQNSSSNEVSC